MKLKIIALFVIITLSLIQSYAQYEDFPLSEYKLPYLKRHSLETDFHLSSNNTYLDYPTNIDYGETETSNINSYSGHTQINYNSYLNEVDKQRESDIGIDFSGQFHNRIIHDRLSLKNYDINPTFYSKLLHREYIQPKRFIESGFDASYSYGKYYDLISTDYETSSTKLKVHSLLFSFPIKMGNGRIEQIQDARHAIYIFEELDKQDRISGDKNFEEITEFANLVSRLKNKRFFDSRKRRIYELEAVDSHLVSNNHVQTQDARYFTTLSDYWDYGGTPVRYSGNRISLALYPGYYLYDYNIDGRDYSDGEANFVTHATFIYGGLEFKHEKPLNLYWQNSFDMYGYLGNISGNIAENTNSRGFKLKIPNAQAGMNHILGYYPNTRTHVDFNYGLQYAQLFDKTDISNEVLGLDGKGIKASSGLSVYFYISPQLRLSIYSSVYYIWQDSNDQVILNFNDVTGSIYYPELNETNSVMYYDFFKTKEITHQSSIRLTYSFF